MKDKENLHKQVQEHIDCFAATDPLSGMSVLKDDSDKDAAALKWLALTGLHGVNNDAKKITIAKDKNGGVKVMAKYRKKDLPDPGADVAEKVFDAIRGITHIEGDKGKTDWALGIRDSSVQLKVKIEKTGDGEEVTIKFPG